MFFLFSIYVFINEWIRVLLVVMVLFVFWIKVKFFLLLENCIKYGFFFFKGNRIISKIISNVVVL